MEVIAIARNIPDNKIIPAFHSAINGGIKLLEITLNSKNAFKQIKSVSETFSQENYTKRGVVIGAGTVLSVDDTKRALDSGARFIVSPHTDPEIIRYCRENYIPVYPGAFSPTEIKTAWEAGATMVKIFPAGSAGGPSYIKNLKGPFNNIKMLACGGVTPENCPDYAVAGTDGIAVGASLFNPQWMDREDWQSLESYARNIVFLSS